MSFFGGQNGGSSTETEIIGWHPEPTERGTWGISSTCLSTMAIAIWTSLHLNIPAHKEAHRQNLVRKVSWLTCGVFAPELIVWCAYEQYKDAKRQTRRMKQLLSDRGSQDVDIPSSSAWEVLRRCFKKRRGASVHSTEPEGRTKEVLTISF